MKTIQPKTAKELLKVKQMLELANKPVNEIYESCNSSDEVLSAMLKIFTEEAMLIDSEFGLTLIKNQEKFELNLTFVGFTFFESAVAFAKRVIQHDYKDTSELVAFIGLHCPNIHCLVVQANLCDIFNRSVKRSGIMDKSFLDMDDDEVEIAMFCRKFL